MVLPVVGLLIVGYGCALVFYGANRGRKYLRFIVPATGDEPYRFVLVGFVSIVIGGILVAFTIPRF